MASYPAFPQLLASVHEQFDDLTVDRAIDGTGHGRRFYASKKHRFTLRHVMSETDLATLIAFYDANATLAVDMTYERDRITYTNLLINGLPRYSNIGRGLVSVEVQFEPI